jgi:endoplasmic reticulum chaperone BiP
VLATNGDTHLGGEDFDQRIMDHFIRLVKRKHGRDISRDGRALGKLRRECERVMSSQHQVRVEVEALFDGVNFSESHQGALRGAQQRPVPEDDGAGEEGHADAGLSKGDIDEIVLVGGIPRIHKVRELIKEYFNGKEPNMAEDILIFIRTKGH